MNGYDIGFQEYNEELSNSMKDILLNANKDDILICMPEVFEVFAGN